MDLEENGMSAFSVELMKKLAKDFYDIGRKEGYDVGFTVAPCSVMEAVGRGKNLVEVVKYIEDFLNGLLADKDAKAKCEELAKMRLGGLDCDESR